MHPSSLLPELYADRSLSRLAHSALPGAPVRPHVERRRRVRGAAAAMSQAARRLAHR